MKKMGPVARGSIANARGGIATTARAGTGSRVHAHRHQEASRERRLLHRLRPARVVEHLRERHAPASAGASVATTRIVVMSLEDAARVIVADPALASASASSGGGASPLPGVFEDEKKPIARRAEDLERDAEWRGGPVTRILREPERHRPLLAADRSSDEKNLVQP